MRDITEETKRKFNYDHDEEWISLYLWGFSPLMDMLLEIKDIRKLFLFVYELGYERGTTEEQPLPDRCY